MNNKTNIEDKEELLRKISKEQYGDEWFIEKAILSHKAQQEKTYTFFRDDEQEDLLKKYNWCQRPDSTNMSLHRFIKNGEIEGYMSESLAEKFGLVQVDLNEFIHKFVKPIIKQNIQLESDKQKLIEKLEEDARSYYTVNEDEEYERNKNVEEYAQEILKIVKGENNEYK